MNNNLNPIVIYLLQLAAYIIISLVVAAYYYYIKQKYFFGKFIGGVIVGFIGAIVGALVFDTFTRLITFRVMPFLVNQNPIKMNFIAVFLGTYIFIYALRKASHDRNRIEGE